jgi:hypothetical protein
MPTKAQLAINAIQEKYGTFDPSKMQVQRWQYYDNIGLSTTPVNRLTFFSNPIGSYDSVLTRNKTLEETNIRRSGELDEAFVIMAVKTEIAIAPITRQATAVQNVTTTVVQGYTPLNAALRNLYYRGIFSVNYGQKNYIQIEQPFQMCPPGFGPSIKTIGAVGAGAFVPTSNWLRPSNDPRDVYQMTPPIMVEKGQTFSANIDFPTAGYLTPDISGITIGGSTVSVLIGVTFDGYVLRPIQ